MMLAPVVGLAASMSEALKESREFAHECADEVLAAASAIIATETAR